MNNQQTKRWAAKTVQRLVSEQLSERSKVDILKAAALTETLLGFFRGYRDEVFRMLLDFKPAIDQLEQEAGVKLSKGQQNKLEDMLKAEVRGLLKNFKEFEAILNGQLQMLNTLDEKKQEVLHQLDEQLHEEQELMRAIYNKVVREGKGMVNVNRLKQQLNAA